MTNLLISDKKNIDLQKERLQILNLQDAQFENISDKQQNKIKLRNTKRFSYNLLKLSKQ